MSPSALSARSLPAEWRYALLGGLASIPITVGLDGLYRSEMAIAGGIVVIGSFIAGALAPNAPTRSAAAGFRTGLLGAGWVLVVAFPAMVRFAVEFGPFWLGSTVATALGVLILTVFYATAMVLCGGIGALCGRIGGWVTATIAGRRGTTADA